MSTSDAILLASILFPILVSIGQSLVKYVESRLPAAQRAQVESAVNTVVRSVEQAAPLLNGAEKRNQALSMLSVLLKQMHISASPELLSVLIEAAVHAMNQGAGSATVQAPKISPVPTMPGSK
jgi:hypothetical protein